jgi:hypothetical protein
VVHDEEMRMTIQLQGTPDTRLKQSTRFGLLTLLLVLLIPSTSYGQSWMYVSPGEIYQYPGEPSCYTITVGDGAYMMVDLEYYYEGGGPYYAYGWSSLDSYGESMVCVDAGTPAGAYVFTGIRNSYYYWEPFTPVYATLNVNVPSLPPSPVIYGLGPGCNNWDCIWIGGANFQQDSVVHVFSHDWSEIQTFWGPAWGYSPALVVDVPYLALQLTNPALLSSFGTYGVHVLVANPGGVTSAWVWTQAAPPAINSAGTGCEDGYCLQFAGTFPLNAVVDFRLPGQPDVIPNAYSDLSVTSTFISLRLSPGVRHDFDVNGLYAWVVNPPLANWSDAYYIPPVDRAVIGHVDGVVLSGPQYYVSGWACSKNYVGSIQVEFVIGGGGEGAPAFSGIANGASEPAVAAACNTTGTAYRFFTPISVGVIESYGGQPVYVRGISPFGLGNSLIGNSGVPTVPNEPPSGPPLTLSWKQDYIRDGAGSVFVIARPAPSNATPPSAPASLTVTATTPTSVSLSWPASSSSGGAGLAGYKIYRRRGSGASLPIGSVGPGTPTVTFSDTTVQSGLTYTYTVVAVNFAEVHSAGISASATTP